MQKQRTSALTHAKAPALLQLSFVVAHYWAPPSHITSQSGVLFYSECFVRRLVCGLHFACRGACLRLEWRRHSLGEWQKVCSAGGVNMAEWPGATCDLSNTGPPAGLRRPPGVAGIPRLLARAGLGVTRCPTHWGDTVSDPLG